MSSSNSSSDYNNRFRNVEANYTDFKKLTNSASNSIRVNPGGFYSKQYISDAKKDIKNIYRQAADLRKLTSESSHSISSNFKDKKLSKSEPSSSKSSDSTKVKESKLSKSEKKKETKDLTTSMHKLSQLVGEVDEFVNQTALGFHTKDHVVSTYEKLHKNPEISEALDEIARMEKSGSINSKSLNLSADKLTNELLKAIGSPDHGFTNDEIDIIKNLLKQIKAFKYEQSLEKCKALADPLMRADSPVNPREAFSNANFTIVENAIQASQLEKTGKLLPTSAKSIDPTVLQNIKFGSPGANAAVAKTIPYLFDDYANTTISQQNGIIKFSNPKLGEIKISIEDWKNGDRSKIPLTPEQKVKYQELVSEAKRNLGQPNPDLKKMFNPNSKNDFLYRAVHDDDISYINQAKRSDRKRMDKVNDLKKRAETLKQNGELSKAESLIAEANILSSKKSDVEIQKNLSLADKIAIRVYSTDDGCALINGINRGLINGWDSDKLKEAMMHSFVFAQGLDQLPDYEFKQEGSFGYRGEIGDFEWGNVLKEKIDKGKHVHVNPGFTSMSYATRDSIGGDEYASKGPSESFFKPEIYDDQLDDTKSRWGTIYSNPRGVKDITAFSYFEDRERELIRGPGIEILIGTIERKSEGENLTLLDVATVDYKTFVKS